MLRASVLKGAQAVSGAAVLIEPRSLDDLMLGESLSSEAGSSDNPDLPPDPALVNAQRSAERLLSEARVRRDDLLGRLTQEAQAARDELERELAERRAAAVRELAELRGALEEEIRRATEEKFMARYAHAVESLEQAASSLGAAKEKYLQEIECQAYQLVLAVMRNLLAGETPRRPELMAKLVAEGLAQLLPRPEVQVLLDPATLEVLRQDSLLEQAAAARGLRLEAVELLEEAALHPGQFELRAGAARIGFDLDKRAAELLAQLEERYTRGDHL